MKIAIFDRDGTLNPLGDDYLSHPDQWQPLPGALQAVASAGKLLARHFPAGSSNPNELPDQPLVL